jgi:two-component system sensor histidine kinase KdpD
MKEVDDRPSAEQMLERVRLEAGAGARGRLRIYLGMAPGVGKTFAMLHEGRRRKQRGTDVVVGFVETYGRPLTIQAIGDLEVVPRKKIDYKGVTLEELDAAAVIARKPQVALVDELAHTNAPGSKNDKRWQDVQELLDAGITVISTVNIQHVESLADIVETITGVAVRERIPDAAIDGADEVEIVDMSPNALRSRIRHGNVYPPERAQQALHSFFREGNLNALRELALRKVATAVEQDLEEYMRDQQIDTAWSAAERVIVGVDDSPAAQSVIRRAWRLSTHLQTDLIAVFVETPGWAGTGPDERRRLEENLRFAEDLGAEIHRMRAANPAEGLLELARDKNAGSVVVGRSGGNVIRRLSGGSTVDRLLRNAKDVDVHVVTRRESE